MRLLDIALKDLTRSFRTAFLLVIMFVVPLGTSALMFFAFGGFASDEGITLPATTLRVVNQDRGAVGINAGRLLTESLREEGLADLLVVEETDDADAARLAVDAQQADVALIIPVGFSQALVGPGAEAAVTIYQDPTLTVGPALVRGIVAHVTDRFSATKIALETAAAQFAEEGATLSPGGEARLAQAFNDAVSAWLGDEHAGGGGEHPLVALRGVGGEQAATGVAAMLGPIMAGQMIFAAFFAAAFAYESFLREDEEGTLPRLFTTPVQRSTIMGGKFLAAGLLVLVQSIVLMLGTGWALGIEWGRVSALAMLEVGLVVATSGMGAFLVCWVKSTRQSGPVIGGGLTVSSMLGGLFTAGVPSLPPVAQTATLVFPQGWAMRGWLAALEGGGPSDVWPPVLVLVLYGGVLFAIGVARFRRRFA